MPRIVVLGAGSWGTTLADHLARNGREAVLWARDPLLEKTIREKKENPAYLPGIRLDQRLSSTSDMREALSGADIVVSAVPSHGVRDVFARASGHLDRARIVVSAAKGIEEGTLLTVSGILKEVLPGDKRVVVLSGPSFAREVASGLPVVVTASSSDMEAAMEIQDVFRSPDFRVYTNSDVAGVELGGALKNIIAIASGISDGLGLGNNARAALITRGLAEMARLGVSMGARRETFFGLSGLGDLVLTCTGAASRNYSVGLGIGKGKTTDEVLSGMRMVAEGVRTSRAALGLARLRDTDMPITEAVVSVLFHGRPPREAVLMLMTREPKEE